MNSSNNYVQYIIKVKFYRFPLRTNEFLISSSTYIMYYEVHQNIFL